MHHGLVLGDANKSPSQKQSRDALPSHYELPWLFILLTTFNLSFLYRTPLHYAAGHVHYDCVILLVGSGSNINKADSNSCTALHYASAHDEDAKYVFLY